MNEFEWKAAQREKIAQERLRVEAEERKARAEWCAAWFAMAARLGLAEARS